jgi:methyl-accepting chemotaxis protein
MADQLTPEEIAAIFEEYRRSQQSLQRAQEDFGKALGRSATQLTSSLYKGEKGIGQFGDAIESAASALQLLILAIPGLGIVAKAATVAMGLLAKGVNAAAKQGDALYKTYQDLGKAGATASDGITGVFRNMQNLGYGIEELDKMVQLVTQNSETLAKFSLTAADGTNAFAEGMAKIQRDGQLRDLGKTTDDINSAGAAFIRQNVNAI